MEGGRLCQQRAPLFALHCYSILRSLRTYGYIGSRHRTARPHNTRQMRVGGRRRRRLLLQSSFPRFKTPLVLALSLSLSALSVVTQHVLAASCWLGCYWNVGVTALCALCNPYRGVGRIASRSVAAPSFQYLSESILSSSFHRHRHTIAHCAAAATLRLEFASFHATATSVTRAHPYSRLAYA